MKEEQSATIIKVSNNILIEINKLKKHFRKYSRKSNIKEFKK